MKLQSRLADDDAPKYTYFIADHSFLFALKSQNEVYFMGRFVVFKFRMKYSIDSKYLCYTF